ncbi:hypothetical protein LT493_20735 [Streptomyces tricolor]|nr:hypothetical protein [Streptomyces tricolor]
MRRLARRAGRRPPLLLLPFNLLGNFPSPRELLTGLKEAGGVAVLSVFHAFETATDLRRDYYTACGISPLEEHPRPLRGVVFRSGTPSSPSPSPGRHWPTSAPTAASPCSARRMNSIGRA